MMLKLEQDGIVYKLPENIVILNGGGYFDDWGRPLKLRIGPISKNGNNIRFVYDRPWVNENAYSWIALDEVNTMKWITVEQFDKLKAFI